MLSRAFIFSVKNCRVFASKAKDNIPSALSPTKDDKSKDQPLWSRPVRQEPGKVRHGFLPEEWFQFFYKKTGVTGPYAFAFTFGTYLISKEIYVLEHEYYNGLSMAIVWVYGIKTFGPKLARYLDKERDEYEAAWNESRNANKRQLEEMIENEEKNVWCMDGQTILLEAKRENVALQLEAVYRERLQHVYEEVKRRLDYQVEKQNVERRIAQKNLVDWVIRQVKKAITSEQEKKNIDKCIADLENLLKKA